MSRNGQRDSGHGDHKSQQYKKSESMIFDSDPKPTLAALGISRDESSKWQKLAAIPQRPTVRIFVRRRRAGELLT
jgi:hypothetical protein